MLTRKLYVFQFLGPLCNTVSGNYLHFTTYDSCVALPKISHVENYSTEVFFHVSPYVPATFQLKVLTPHMQGTGLWFYIAVSVLIQKQAYC